MHEDGSHGRVSSVVQLLGRTDMGTGYGYGTSTHIKDWDPP